MLETVEQLSTDPQYQDVPKSTITHFAIGNPKDAKGALDKYLCEDNKGNQQAQHSNYGEFEP